MQLKYLNKFTEYIKIWKAEIVTNKYLKMDHNVVLKKLTFISREIFANGEKDLDIAERKRITRESIYAKNVLKNRIFK